MLNRLNIIYTILFFLLLIDDSFSINLWNSEFKLTIEEPE